MKRVTLKTQLLGSDVIINVNSYDIYKNFKLHGIHTDYINSISLMSKTINYEGKQQIIQNVTSEQLLLLQYPNIPFTTIKSMENNFFIKIVLHNADMLNDFKVDVCNILDKILPPVMTDIIESYVEDDILSLFTFSALVKKYKVMDNNLFFNPSHCITTHTKILDLKESSRVVETIIQPRVIIKKLTIILSSGAKLLRFAISSRRKYIDFDSKYIKGNYVIKFEHYINNLYNSNLVFKVVTDKSCDIKIFSENYNVFTSSGNLKYPYI